VPKCESLRYDLKFKYKLYKKGHQFVDYLGPTYFNYLNNNFKRHLKPNNYIYVNYV